jgi:hypothetical protein
MGKSWMTRMTNVFQLYHMELNKIVMLLLLLLHSLY